MKSNAPTFKVAVSKRSCSSVRKTSKKIRSGMIRKPSVSSRYRKHEGVNLYMSKVTPTSIPAPPQVLVAYIKEKVKTLNKSEVLMSLGNSDQLSSRDVKTKTKKKQINDFIAFRSYYSRLLNGILTQTELSTIISKHWTVDKQTRKNWELIAQEYNCDASGKHFFNWLEVNYGIDKQWLYEIVQYEECLTPTTKKPYVENIYNSGFKQRIDSPNQKDITFSQSDNSADWLVDPIFFDTEFLATSFYRTNLIISDCYSLMNSV